MNVIGMPKQRLQGLLQSEKTSAADASQIIVELCRGIAVGSRLDFYPDPVLENSDLKTIVDTLNAGLEFRFGSAGKNLHHEVFGDIRGGYCVSIWLKKNQPQWWVDLKSKLRWLRLGTLLRFGRH